MVDIDKTSKFVNPNYKKQRHRPIRYAAINGALCLGFPGGPEVCLGWEERSCLEKILRKINRYRNKK